MSAAIPDERDEIPRWLEVLSGDLSDAETVAAALQDVVAACGNVIDAAWIDLRQQSDVAVWVLATGVLHRVVGPRDAKWDFSKPDDPAATVVEYSASRIRRSASYRVEIQRERRQDSMMISRAWTFTELGAFGSLNLQWPLREGGPRRQDPTAFANALVKAILAAGDD